MMFTLLIITAFIVWFSSLWIAILSLLSIIGGWKKLSRIYPLVPQEKNNNPLKYSMSSMRMGFVNYRSTINITFTNGGMILEALKIFSVMHKPLFIPYNKISGIKHGKFISTYTEFKVEDKQIVIYGKAGDELYSRLAG